jgi:hypothetical protein
MSRTKELSRWLAAQGWWLARKGRHAVWHYGRRGVLTVSSTSGSGTLVTEMAQARRVMRMENT